MLFRTFPYCRSHSSTFQLLGSSFTPGALNRLNKTTRPAKIIARIKEADYTSSMLVYPVVDALML